MKNPSSGSSSRCFSILVGSFQSSGLCSHYKQFSAGCSDIDQIKIISVKIHQKINFLFRVEIRTEILVIGLYIPQATMRNTTAELFFYKQLHVKIREQR